MRFGITDETLVSKTLAGDTIAFSVLVERYRQAIYALIFHHVRDFEVAQDLAQDTFVQAYLKLSTLRDSAKFVVWLQRLSQNLCYSWLRQSSLQILSLQDPLTGDIPDPHAVPHQTVEKAQYNALVRDTVAQLPEKQRLTISLFYLGGLSYQEIADFLGESVGAVESRLHRSRIKLKEQMMAMLDDSLRSHPLPQQFTQEVLQTLQILGVKVGSVPPAKPWRESIQPNSSVLMREGKAQTYEAPLTAWEAIAIRRAVDGELPVRPLTYDVLHQIMLAFDIRLEKVQLSDTKRKGFSAHITFGKGDTRHIISAPGGEGLAVAAMTGAPIFGNTSFLKGAKRQAASAPSDPLAAPAGDAQNLSAPATAPDPAEDKEQSDAEERKFQEERQLKWRTIHWPEQVTAHITRITSNLRGSAVVTLGYDAKSWGFQVFLTIDQAASIAAHIKDKTVHVELPPVLKTRISFFSHDLIQKVLESFSISMQLLGVDATRDSTYFGVAIFESNGQKHYVDLRPSDGLALAVRFNCPIYLTREFKETVLEPPSLQEKPEYLQLWASAFDCAFDCINKGAPHSRVLLKSTPDGKCHFEVRAAGAKLVWTETGGSFQECCSTLRDFKKLAGNETMEKDGKQYAWSVSTRKKPERYLKFQIKPLRNVATTPPEGLDSIPQQAIVGFQRDFITKIGRGHSIVAVLDALARRQSNDALEWVLNRTAAELKTGTPFLEAIKHYPMVFDEEFTSRWEEIDRLGLNLEESVKILRKT